MKDTLQKIRHGVEQLLKIVEGLVISTPAGPPIAALNRIVQVINVRFVISQYPARKLTISAQGRRGQQRCVGTMYYPDRRASPPPKRRMAEYRVRCLKSQNTNIRKVKPLYPHTQI